ncbi:MAG: MEDS domain-containing protein [Planctomycetes bacterium]|nr:MEDS domain-containing protein [Planctomycetota bacterium]
MGLIKSLEELKIHDHFCLVYKNQKEQFSVVIPFIRIGLERGEKNVYIADDNTVQSVLDEMRQQGIDADSAVKSGALAVVTKKDTYLKQGYFDPDCMLTLLTEFVEAAKAEGYSALRVTGEMTWFLGNERGVERLMEYESKLNYFFRDHDCLAICQYNYNRFSPEVILDMIYTHPLVIHNGTICKNFYYIPPDEFLNERQPKHEVDRLLENILSRARAEEELFLRSLKLKESRELLRTVLNNAPITIFAIDTKGVFTLSEGKGLEKVNLKPGENVGVSALEIFGTLPVIQPNGETITGREVILRVLAGETLTGITRLGNVYFDNQFVPYYDARGKLTGVIGIATIITERLRAEEELIQLHQAVSTSGEAVFMTDLDGVITYINPEFTRLYGFEPEEVIGKVTPRILKSNVMTTEDYKKFWETLLKKQIVKGELTNKTKDGRLLNIEGSANAIIDGKGVIIGFLAVQRDITERRKAEDTLRKREKLLSKTQEIAQLGSWELDIVNNRLSWSDEVYRIFGLEPQEFVATYEAFIERVHPDDRAAVNAAYSDSLSQGRNAYEIEHRVIKKSTGEVRTVYEKCEHIRDETGRIIRSVGMVHDITERKKLESQFLHAQKMEAIGRLVGGVAHDFNNVLTVIDGYSTMMLYGFEPESPFRESVMAIKKASDYAAGLTRQLLAFSRKQVLRRKTLNINVLVTDMEKMLNRVIGEDIKVSLILSPELKNTSIDQGQIEQVMMNLAVNARDAMPKGGALTISTENVIIDEEYCRINTDAKPGDFARLSIQDTGIGMSKDTQKHLFEPFFTTKGLGKGTGLGLSVVYGIVKQHDGWVNAYSESGKGTIFHIYLPALSSAVIELDAKKEPLPPDKLRGNGERILIIEDEPKILEFLSYILQKNNYQVWTAGTAKEACNIFKQERNRFHVILSDVVLPDKSGTELVEELVALNPGIKVIFQSGYSDEQSQWTVIRKKGHHFLQKPYGAVELLTVMRQVIGQGAVK